MVNNLKTLNIRCVFISNNRCNKINNMKKNYSVIAQTVDKLRF